MHSIEENFDLAFWKSNCYYFHTDNGHPDDRANALAVLSGLAKPEAYKGILNILQTVENASPYMEKYVLDAMCEMGYIDEAILRIKRRYKEMVEEDYSTLWEFWDKSGTMNHAWSGGPLITMAKYIAGIRPADVGYKKVEIKPHHGNLKYFCGWTICPCDSHRCPLREGHRGQVNMNAPTLPLLQGGQVLHTFHCPFSHRPRTLRPDIHI